MSNNNDKLMTASDAARPLKLSSNGVRFLETTGALMPAFRTVRGMRLYRQSDVERIRRERERKAAA